uniref:Arsenite methyltransferase n=1 Tax=Strongyloides papillosus TaxID=174720 RepID=A0A0N5BI03_STREA
MTLNQVKSDFLNLLNKLDSNEKELFSEWVLSVLKKDVKYVSESLEPTNEISDEDILDSIASRLRDMVPVDATLTSENVIFQETGPDSDCKPNTTIHVDAFLYDDEFMEYMIEEGTIQPHYCVDCLSSNIQRKNFISHSLSTLQQRYIFNFLLPQFTSFENKIILDLGSRMGAVMYGANIYSGGKSKVIGIEMNKDWCKIQREIISSEKDLLKKNNDGIVDIEVVEGNILDYANILNSADIITMNNVFSFFNDKKEQKKLWKFVFQNLKSGALLVHNPKLDDEYFDHLNMDFNIYDVIEPLSFKSVLKKFSAGDKNIKADCNEIRIYKIKTPLPK